MDDEFKAALSAMQMGDTDELSRLISKRPGLAIVQNDGQTLLWSLFQQPVKPRAAESARILIEAGADVESRPDPNGGTPLSGALCTNQADVARVLLEFGADLAGPSGYASDVTVLDLADIHLDNLERQSQPEFDELISLFSSSAGRPVPNRTPIGKATPLVSVSDVGASVEYYCDKLGFNLVFAEGDFAIVRRGATELHLIICECEDRRHQGNSFISVRVASAKDLCWSLQQTDVKIARELVEQPWGETNFKVEDPDGNWLMFSEWTD